MHCELLERMYWQSDVSWANSGIGEAAALRSVGTTQRAAGRVVRDANLVLVETTPLPLTWTVLWAVTSQVGTGGGANARVVMPFNPTDPSGDVDTSGSGGTTGGLSPGHDPGEVEGAMALGDAIDALIGAGQ